MAGNESIEGAQGKGRAIFISYRRDDTEGEAGRLFDDLVRAYGDDSVFMDVAGIQPGLDFRKAIDDNVVGCGVLLAVIGPTWATITGRDGTRRLDNPDDYVRLEIASALKRSIPVIPVLVHDSRMPGLEQLPEDLKDLRYRNSVELTHARWNSDVALLVSALKSYVNINQANQTETVHATVPVQLPAPQSSEPVAVTKSRNLFPLGIAALVCIAVIVGVLAFLHFHSTPAPQPSPQPAPISGGQTSVQPQPVTPAGGSGPEAALLGKWKNSNEPGVGDDLEHISVADFNGQLMVEGFGKCAKRLCNWGPKKATLTGATAVTESWDLRNDPQETKNQRSVVLSIQPSGGGLDVTVQNTFHRPNGQTVQNVNPLQFVKMP